MSWFKKCTLVTRGYGFTGSHLCDGHEIPSIDDYYTDRRQNEHLPTKRRFKVMRHNITMPPYVVVDDILNLARPAFPIYYLFDPVQTLKTSVHGAINTLGLAKRIKAKMFQASAINYFKSIN